MRQIISIHNRFSQLSVVLSKSSQTIVDLFLHVILRIESLNHSTQDVVCMNSILPKKIWYSCAVSSWTAQRISYTKKKYLLIVKVSPNWLWNLHLIGAEYLVNCKGIHPVVYVLIRLYWLTSTIKTSMIFLLIWKIKTSRKCVPGLSII